MNGQQQLVGALGITLVGLNFWDTGRHTLASGAFNSSATTAQTEAAHTALKSTALELLFVGGATLLAGFSGSLGTAMAAVMVALTILWAIKHFSSSTTTGGVTK